MTIECRCPGCGGQFRAGDEAAGRRVKCPRCAAVIAVPAAVSTGPAWFVRTADEKQHGPMAKEQLDRLVAERRLDAFCEVRRADWDQWQLIEEVYPALAVDVAEDDPPASKPGVNHPADSDAGQSGRVRPCPDCGQTVSRRAAACPHCGCPLLERPPAAPPIQSTVVPQPSIQPPRETSVEARAWAARRLTRQVAFLAVGLLLLAGVVSAGVIIGLQLRNRSRSEPPIVPPVAQSQPAEPTVTPSPTSAAALTDEQIAHSKEKVAADMAREVDSVLRLRHNTMQALPQLGEYAKLLQEAQEMADPLTKPSKNSVESKKKAAKQDAAAAGPYQSQFDALCRECREYLDANVKPPVDREETIRNVGREWVRMRLPEQRMLEEMLQPKP